MDAWPLRSFRILVCYAVPGAAVAIVIIMNLRRPVESPVTFGRSNINQIAKALQMYADNNGGQFPSGAPSPTENLWLLYNKYVADGRVFVNPRVGVRQSSLPDSNAPSTRVPPEWIRATAFIYREGFSISDAAEIILYERTPKNGERFVALGDGTIEILPEAEFQKRLDAQVAENAGKRLNAAPAAATPPSSNP